MKFEVSESLRTTIGPDQLLPAIESQFRKVSRKAHRSGQTVIVESIEASFGSINRSDTTTITLSHKDDGWLIVADVDYHPSAAFWIFLVILLFTWILWLLPIVFYLSQKNAVRKAIEDCFKRVRDEFGQQGGESAVSTSSGPISELERLAALRERGFLSDTEFADMKKKFIDR